MIEESFRQFQSCRKDFCWFSLGPKLFCCHLINECIRLTITKYPFSEYTLLSTLAFNNAHSHVVILPHSIPYHCIRLTITTYPFSAYTLFSTLAFNNAHSHVAILPNSTPYHSMTYAFLLQHKVQMLVITFNEREKCHITSK